MKRWHWLLLACPLAVLAAPWLGAPADEFVFWQLRVPRVLVGAITGATLATAGAAFQALFRNPLATPSTVGTTAGATLGALLSLTLGAAGAPGLLGGAFAGGLATSLFVSSIALAGRATLSDLLLVGVAISLAAGSAASFLQAIASDRALLLATHWSLGSLAQIGYGGLPWLIPLELAVVAALLSQVRGLQALQEGEALALSRGVPVQRLRALVLTAASLGVAATIAWCGPIAFVGLVVPHLVRMFLKEGALRRILPGSALAGAAFLVMADGVARLVPAPTELPVGVITAALGAPALLLLLVRQRRGT